MRSPVSQRRLAVLVALFTLLLPASAARTETVTATQVAERTNKVMEAFDWTNDLDLLKEKARKEKKLVFWLQIVGDLNGGLWSAGHSLRAVMLSNAEVIAQLNRNFACGWTNIKGKTPYAGSSNTHFSTNPAMEVTNCAGHHNVQMFFMTSDGRVLHCLPGYWNPRDFLEELQVAVDAGKLYYRKDISAAERNREYLDLQLRHALSHTQALRDASAHQGFDKMDLEKRKESDFQRKEGFVTGLKTPDQVLHERLAERPFLPFDAFPVAAFIDMGLKRYQYDYGLAGKTWPKTGKPLGSKGTDGTGTTNAKGASSNLNSNAAKGKK